MSGTAAVSHFFFFLIWGSCGYGAAAYMKQNAGGLEEGGFGARRWPGQTPTGHAVPSGTDIPGTCNAPVCAHSADTEISPAKLTGNLWLFPPGNGPGGSGRERCLSEYGLGAYKEPWARVSHQCSRLRTPVVRAVNVLMLEMYRIFINLDFFFFKFSKIKPSQWNFHQVTKWISTQNMYDIHKKLCEVTNLNIKYSVSCSGLFLKYSSILKYIFQP